ncbi:MAG: DNA translocase FtsK [Thermoleophilia bacterium]|nr:DNA translocase FtsK [Thermoleophilia bacterium]
MPAKGSAKKPQHSSQRTREIVALVLLGIAVFVLFALIGTEKGGAVGRAVETALSFAFGRLAFLIPVALIAVAVTTVFEMKLWRSYRFAGVLVFLFGLFVLVAGGAPPFGGHGDDLFVRMEFETRAGGLGEALYAAFDSLMGVLGVAIVGWLTALVGLSLATGVTALMLGRRTRQAAKAVKTTAERSTLATWRRPEDDGGWGREAPTLAGGASLSAGPAGGAAPASTPRLGPIDLVGGEGLGETAALAATGTHEVFGEAFDDWGAGRSVTRSPLAPAGPGVVERPLGVLDGAQAYADIFGAGVGATGAATADGSSGRSPHRDDSTAEMPATPEEVAAAGTAVGVTQRGDETMSGDDTGSHQEALPGLARQPRQIELAVAEPTYILPEPDMLRKSTPAAGSRAGADRDTAAVLLQALSQFGVEARVIGMVVGPRVTRYELQLAPGTKVAKVSSLKDDLAYALATTEIRILAPIPGKSAVGVEIPNQRPDWVTLGDIYHEFPKSAGPLMVWLGKDISGKAVYADLTRLPHLLIAGTTGSGKSGCVNCIVSSVLLRSTPEQVRMIMIDPKKVELSHYDRIPHLLVPVVTNMKDAAGVLHNVVKEMEDRYELMELDHARNLAEMNKTRARRGERPVPYILLVIDELADLMMAAPQEVEDHVIRLAQKSRAVGIHLVVATQRPSADVITGMIKANIPSRIAFAVSSQTDSRVILDVNGAETLLGMGDMLFKPLGSSHMQRVQGAYITEEEIATLVNHWRHQAEPEFREELLRRPVEAKKGEDDLFDPDSDDLLADAAQLVIETGSASVSMLQRRLRVGYTRAGRLIDMLERRGIVGPWEGSKPRQIMVEPDESEHVLAALRAEERRSDEEDGD